MKVIYEKHEYEEYLDKALNGAGYPQYAKSSRVGSYDFTGTHSWDEAKQFALNGWEEGRELVGTIVNDIEAESTVITRQCVWDVTGDFPDVGAFVAGIPECMVRWEDTEITKRVARICYNMTASSGVDKEALRWKGACVLALIDRLQQSGIRCHVDIACCLSKYDDVLVDIITLKRPEEPLHLDLLAFHLTNPSSFRRIMFSFLENKPQDIVSKFHFYSGGGYSCPEKMDAYIPDGETYDLIIPELHLDTVEKAVEEIEKMFQTVCNANLTRGTLDPNEV